MVGLSCRAAGAELALDVWDYAFRHDPGAGAVAIYAGDKALS